MSHNKFIKIQITKRNKLKLWVNYIHIKNYLQSEVNFCDFYKFHGKSYHYKSTVSSLCSCCPLFTPMLVFCNNTELVCRRHQNTTKELSLKHLLWWSEGLQLIKKAGADWISWVYTWPLGGESWATIIVMLIPLILSSGMDGSLLYLDEFLLTS